MAATPTDPALVRSVSERPEANGPDPVGPRVRTRVLVIAPADPLPSGRLRIGQYVELLEADGYSFEFVPVEPVRPTRSELAAIARAARGADVIFVQRIASPLLVLLLLALRKPVVYDLDDAIHFVRTAQLVETERPASFRERARVRYRELLRGSRYYSAQQRPVKLMVRLAAVAIVGNEYLRRELADRHPCVLILPTCVFLPETAKVPSAEKPTRLGWIGVRSNLDELRALESVFASLQERHGDDVILTVVSSEPYETPNMRTEFIEWSLETEADAVRCFDIGLMPVRDNLHARGKCSFKAVQCMSYGIPVVISPVGMNAELVTDGASGFLAESAAEWTEAVSSLIDDVALRREIGHEGRRTIANAYAAERAVATLRDALRHAKGRCSGA